MHGDGGLADLLEGDGDNRVRGAEGVADADVRDARDGHDGANPRLPYVHLAQAVEFIELAHLYLGLLLRVVMVADDDFLVHPDDTVVHFPDADAADVLVVVNGADKDLGAGLRVSFRRGDVVDDGLEQWLHAGTGSVRLHGGDAGLGGGVDEGAVQLGVVRVQLQEQLQHLVHHLVGPGLGAVYLVDADDDGELQLQGLAEHEFRLGHGALESVHHQNDAVHHLQHPLHLPAEVGVAGGVHDIDFGALVHDGGVLGKDGDAPFPLDVVGIHDPLRYILPLAEHAALLQQLVHKSGLAMVYMGYDGNIPYIFSFLIHDLTSFLWL